MDEALRCGHAAPTHDLDRAVPAEVAYRLTSVFKHEIDVCRYLEMHRSNVRNLHIAGSIAPARSWPMRDLRRAAESTAWAELAVCSLLACIGLVCLIVSLVLARSAVVIPPTQLARIVGLRGRYYERGMARLLRDLSHLPWPWGSAPWGSGGPSSAVSLTSLTHC